MFLYINKGIQAYRYILYNFLSYGMSHGHSVDVFRIHYKTSSKI
nr:MAG TPA: hypothetical protein [Caudoviricetes sp.]